MKKIDEHTIKIDFLESYAKKVIEEFEKTIKYLKDLYKVYFTPDHQEHH